MNVPEHQVDQIKNRIDIVDVIGQRVDLKPKGREFKGLCPFHDDNNPSFSVVPGKQKFFCNACGENGDVIEFLKKFDRIEFPEAIRQLGEMAGIKIEAGPRRSPDHDKELELLSKVAEFYQTVLGRNDKAAGYLKRRGIARETIERYGIGFAPPGGDHLDPLIGNSSRRRQKLIELGLLHKGNGRGPYAALRNRIVFPIRNQRGQVIAFGGRLLDSKGRDDIPKYINTSESSLFQKNQELYGLPEARTDRRWQKCLAVVEGYMDAITLTEAGFPAVATMGVSLTEAHARKLLSPGTPLVLGFDGDDAGRRAALKACLTLLPHFRRPATVRFVELPAGEDPDSLIRKGKQEWVKVLKASQPLSAFVTDSAPPLVIGQKPQTIEDWVVYLEELLPQLGQMPNQTFKYLLLDAVGARAGFNEITLKRLLAAAERSQR